MRFCIKLINFLGSSLTPFWGSVAWHPFQGSFAWRPGRWLWMRLKFSLLTGSQRGSLDLIRDLSHHQPCFAKRGLKVNISLIVCLLAFFFSANIYLTIGLEFRSDGKYMALAERRNCKDCISIFSCSVWQLVKVINFSFNWLMAEVKELSKSIFGVPFACCSIEVQVIGHNSPVVVIVVFFIACFLGSMI